MRGKRQINIIVVRFENILNIRFDRFHTLSIQNC